MKNITTKFATQPAAEHAAERIRNAARGKLTVAIVQAGHRWAVQVSL